MQINSKEYLDQLYSDPKWKEGYKDAYIRLQKDVDLLQWQFDRHLDVGCADGAFTKYYMEKYPETEGFGLDISSVVIDQIHDQPGTYMAGNVYKLPFDNNYFDMVHSAELIEHLKDPQKAIDEMRRVLKPNGILILTVPFKEDPLYEEHFQYWDTQKLMKMLGGFEILRYDTEIFAPLVYIRAYKKTWSK